jgi:hypothetical protein
MSSSDVRTFRRGPCSGVYLVRDPGRECMWCSSTSITSHCRCGWRQVPRKEYLRVRAGR